jgi:hypothetical protein
VSLHFPESSVIDLKKRYSNMYIPSDFFLADNAWMNTFPIHQPFKLQYPAAFHVFPKDLVDGPAPMDAVYDPPDADHSFNVKVMLLSTPPPEDLYEKTCHMADSGELDERPAAVNLGFIDVLLTFQASTVARLWCTRRA